MANVSDGKPRISLLLPTMNRLHKLTICLPVFLKTSVIEAQFICIDNFSTDGTWQYLKEMARIDPRLEIHRNPRNIGATPSQILGFTLARAPFVMVLADDDLMHGDYIAEVLEILEGNDMVGVVQHSKPSNELEIEQEFTVIKAGEEAKYLAFKWSGTYTGLTWRMAAFNLDDYKRNRNKLYPQVAQSVNIASQWDLGLVRSSGIKFIDWGDTPLDVQQAQGRPRDMGLEERTEIAINNLRARYAGIAVNDLSVWGYGVYLEMRMLKEERSFSFLVSLTRSVTSISPVLPALLLRSLKLKQMIAGAVIGLISFFTFKWARHPFVVANAWRDAFDRISKRKNKER